MIVALAILAYVIIGTAIGRILFVKRLSDKARYTVGRSDGYTRTKVLIDSDANSSAQTYGLWSPFLWPITLMFFLIQAPTPVERQLTKENELEEFHQKFSSIAEELGISSGS